MACPPAGWEAEQISAGSGQSCAAATHCRLPCNGNRRRPTPSQTALRQVQSGAAALQSRFRYVRCSTKIQTRQFLPWRPYRLNAGWCYRQR